MAKRENLSIKVDYLSMVIEKYHVGEFITRIMGMPIEIFVKRHGNVKHKAYTTHYQNGDISVFGDIPTSEDNPEGLGYYMVLTGTGCSDFFRIRCTYSRDANGNPLTPYYGAFFNHCNTFYFNLDYACNQNRYCNRR